MAREITRTVRAGALCARYVAFASGEERAAALPGLKASGAHVTTYLDAKGLAVQALYPSAIEAANAIERAERDAAAGGLW